MATNEPPADASVPNATYSIDTTTTMVAGLSLEVTLVIYILYSPLPLLITQELLQTLILGNKTLLISSLRNNTILSSYFRNLDSIPSVLLVDNVTDAPTMSPTLSPTVYFPTPAPTRGPFIVPGKVGGRTRWVWRSGSRSTRMPGISTTPKMYI